MSGMFSCTYNRGKYDNKKITLKRTGLIFKDITNGSMTPEVYTASGLMLLVFTVCQYIKSTETKEKKKHPLNLGHWRKHF